MKTRQKTKAPAHIDHGDDGDVMVTPPSNDRFFMPALQASIACQQMSQFQQVCEQAVHALDTDVIPLLREWAASRPQVRRVLLASGAQGFGYAIWMIVVTSGPNYPIELVGDAADLELRVGDVFEAVPIGMRVVSEVCADEVLAGLTINKPRVVYDRGAEAPSKG